MPGEANGPGGIVIPPVAPPTPARDVLGCLVGQFGVTGEWERMPGKPAHPVEGTASGTLLFDHKVVQLDQFTPDGRHVARMLYTYDRSRGDFVAFATSLLATHYEAERGVYDEFHHRLVLRGEETIVRSEPPLAYARTIRFDAEGGFDMSITYPDAPPGTYGEMHLRFRPRRG